MNYTQNTALIPKPIDFNKSKSSSEQIFKLTIYCIILSLATNGLGSSILGFSLFTDVSTLFIYLAIILQIITGKIRLPKILGLIFAYIFVQTFIVQHTNIIFFPTFKTFIGLILFSISTFSFISVYRDRIVDIIKIYYKFVFFISIIGILQPIVFVLSGLSFIPQNVISGTMIAGGSNTFSPEILGILPRAVGLSSEPAHYAIIILPGVFISLLVLIGKARELAIHNKTIAWIILIGFILSFSLVGYFGLILCLISIFSNNLSGKLFTKVSIVLFFVGAFYFISQTNLMSKVTSLPAMFTNISGYQYTSSDLTGFALASNIVVAREGLKKSNYLGTGLNTHKDTYDEVIYTLFDSSQVVKELNRENAGSLLIRIPSEFGIPGIFAFIFFLFHYRLGNKFKPSSIKQLNGMCLVVLIGYAVRNGQYLSIFFWLFLALYYYTYILNQNDLVKVDL